MNDLLQQIAERLQDTSTGREHVETEAQGEQPPAAQASNEGDRPVEPLPADAELERLREERAALEDDRERLQQWYLALRDEQAALQLERQYLAAGQKNRSPEPNPDSTTDSADAPQVPRSSAPSHDDSDRLKRLFAAPAAPEAAAIAPPVASRHTEYELKGVDDHSISEYMARLLARSRPHQNSKDVPHLVPAVTSPAAIEMAASQTAEAGSEAPPPVAARQRPRHDPDAIRAGMTQLREVANHSARQALSQHFWKRYRSTITLKVMLAAMSFVLAGTLYLDHGLANPQVASLAWGAMAIGLIAVSGLVHTFHRVSRMKAQHRESPARSQPD